MGLRLLNRGHQKLNMWLQIFMHSNAVMFKAGTVPDKHHKIQENSVMISKTGADKHNDMNWHAWSGNSANVCFTVSHV